MVSTVGRRPKVPFWAVPVLVVLPVWAFIYIGTLRPAEPGSLRARGAEVYAAQCAACHGSQGEGAAAPAFDAGAVFQTWPSFEDHLEWVQLGGARWAERHGPTYGATATPVNGAAMPGFDGRLDDRDLVHVVLYERTVLAGTNPDAADDERLRNVVAAMDNDPSMTLEAAIHASADLPQPAP